MGEFPTEAGTAECVRFTFSISPSGRPFNLKVADTSGNAVFEMAARDALVSYRFRPPLLGFVKRYTLILRGVDNKIPKNWRTPTKWDRVIKG